MLKSVQLSATAEPWGVGFCSIRPGSHSGWEAVKRAAAAAAPAAGAAAAAAGAAGGAGVAFAS